jgi:hypothetical protein
MRAVIDTSSLLALVRYYLPFDKDDSLKKFIKGKIDSGEIIILDKVVEESKYQAQGIVLKVLDFLPPKSIQTKSNELLPNPKFFNMLENQFCVQVQRKKITAVEFESKKKEYLESTDAKLLLYCLKDKGTLEIDKSILVTEETNSENDGKVFKKLPAICSVLEIEHCNLPSLFKDHFKMNLSKYLK